MRRSAFVPLLCFVAACGVDGLDGTRAPLAQPGPWMPAPDVVAYGNSITMPYDPAGPWDGGIHCGGGLLAGTRVLGDYLLANFPAIDTYGGYSCRQNTADATQMSVHGTGRALDLMITMDGTDADNDAGDPVAAWLVLHAVEVGVQFIIWDHEDWGGARSAPKFRAYTGPVPHTDHIHMELTIVAAAMGTPWFMDGGVTMPADAGTTTPPDAGTVATPDAGTVAPPDAGTTPVPDAGTTTPPPDAGFVSMSDADVPPVDPGTTHRVLRGGCSVAPSGRAPPGWLAAALVVAAFVVSRRRRYPRRG